MIPAILRWAVPFTLGVVAALKICPRGAVYQLLHAKRGPAHEHLQLGASLERPWLHDQLITIEVMRIKAQDERAATTNAGAMLLIAPSDGRATDRATDRANETGMRVQG